MNPQFKKEKIKYFKNLIEIQLEITKIVLKEHEKRERNCDCDCDIENLEKIQKIQEGRINNCNIILGIRKKVRRL